MPTCRCRDFRMAENKLHVCFLHKKPACKKLSTRENLVLTKYFTKLLRLLKKTLELKTSKI